MKRPILTLFIILLSLGLKISAQTNTENNTDSKKIADDFPVYQNTGNPDLDGANYENAKKEWIKNNQSEYNNSINSNPKSETINTSTEVVVSTEKPKTVITKAQYYLMDTDKQKEVNDHPEIYELYNFDARDEDQSKCKVTSTEFNSYSKDKKIFIKNHSELYILVD
jgi:hypothetical protein